MGKKRFILKIIKYVKIRASSFSKTVIYNNSHTTLISEMNKLREIFTLTQIAITPIRLQVGNIRELISCVLIVETDRV